MGDQDFNEGHYTEAINTLHIIMGNLDDYLLEAPAVVKCGVQEDIKRAMDNLMNAYQKIGEESFNENV